MIALQSMVRRISLGEEAGLSLCSTHPARVIRHSSFGFRP